MREFEELTKQIKRDYFDIKENINNPDKLMKLFSFKRPEFENIIHYLKFSVEDGLFEYKITTLNLILEPLNSLQYNSKAMNSFGEQINRAKGLLAVTLIQRLIATGVIKIVEKKGEGSMEFTQQETEQPGIKEIIDYVQKEPKANPLILQNNLFKKIIMHIKMYKNESQKMNELMSKVSAEKKIALKKNFAITLAGQVSKMREAYNDLINIAVEKEQVPVAGNILLRYDFKPAYIIYTSQIEIFSKILSTLQFANTEKFNTRELLLNLTGEQKSVIKLITKEREAYSSIVPFDRNGSETEKSFSKRIIEFLGKEKDWLRIHPGK
ncbi:MAG: hypothetical protein PF693_03500 [Spirochaetia bacterium]|jgi:hypothetical protein|nr:hypothetical protein [Spirochaetia bacterium]